MPGGRDPGWDGSGAAGPGGAGDPDLDSDLDAASGGAGNAGGASGIDGGSDSEPGAGASAGGGAGAGPGPGAGELIPDSRSAACRRGQALLEALRRFLDLGLGPIQGGERPTSPSPSTTKGRPCSRAMQSYFTWAAGIFVLIKRLGRFDVAQQHQYARDVDQWQGGHPALGHPNPQCGSRIDCTIIIPDSARMTVGGSMDALPTGNAGRPSQSPRLLPAAAPSTARCLAARAVCTARAIRPRVRRMPV